MDATLGHNDALFDTGGMDRRVQTVIHGALGALPRALRARAGVIHNTSALAGLTEAMTAWSSTVKLSKAEFAERFLGRDGDDPVAKLLREAALAAAGRAPLRDAAEKLAEAMQTAGLDRWPRFVADAQRRAVDQAAWPPSYGHIVNGRLNPANFGNAIIHVDLGIGSNTIEPAPGTPIYPHGEGYVPLDRIAQNARQILQCRRVFYDSPSGTYRMGFSFPDNTTIIPTYARRGPDRGQMQSGYVFSPPGSPPVGPGKNPQSSVRVGLRSPYFPGPYFRVYNDAGQAISPVTGRIGPDASTHYPLGSALPSGLPQ